MSDIPLGRHALLSECTRDAVLSATASVVWFRRCDETKRWCWPRRSDESHPLRCLPLPGARFACGGTGALAWAGSFGFPPVQFCDRAVNGVA
jgi:hypothetical protein